MYGCHGATTAGSPPFGGGKGGQLLGYAGTAPWAAGAMLAGGHGFGGLFGQVPTAEVAGGLPGNQLPPPPGGQDVGGLVGQVPTAEVAGSLPGYQLPPPPPPPPAEGAGGRGYAAPGFTPGLGPSLGTAGHQGPLAAAAGGQRDVSMPVAMPPVNIAGPFGMAGLGHTAPNANMCGGMQGGQMPFPPPCGPVPGGGCASLGGCGPNPILFNMARGIAGPLPYGVAGGGAVPNPSAQTVFQSMWGPGPFAGSAGGVGGPGAMDPPRFSHAAAAAGVHHLVAAAYETALGCVPGQLLVSDLQLISVSDLKKAAEALVTLEGPITPIQRGKLLHSVRNALKDLGITPPDMGQVALPTDQGTGRRKRLSQVIDQGADAEFDIMGETCFRELLSGFDVANGGLPAPEEEPSGEQLSALRGVLRSDAAPYCDFAVYGPLGRRQARMLRFTAQVWVGNELVTKQLAGPTNWNAWRSCWRVFRTAMLILKGSPPGPLDEYEECIRKLAADHPDQWGMVLYAEDIMRAEYWERHRRALEDKVKRGLYTEHFDAAAPWAAVIRESARDSQYWYHNIDKPCLLARNRSGARAARPIDGGGESASRGRSRSERRAPRRPAPKRSSAPHTSARQRRDGRYLCNSSGVELCFAWGRSADGCSQSCRAQPKRAHQCEWCLGGHRSVDAACSVRPAGWTPESADNSNSSGSKGKGKGKGSSNRFRR